MPLRTVNFESIPVSTSAVGFTAANLVRAIASPPIAAKVKVEDAAIRMRVDGTDPTSGVGGGEFYDVGASFMVTALPDLAAFRAIRVVDAAQDANITVQYMA